MKLKQLFLSLLLIHLMNSCESDSEEQTESLPIPETITITVEDFEIVIDEKPDQDQILGTIEASTNQGTLEFSIRSQEPDEALRINNITGELTVANASLFIFNENPVITAIIEVRNEEIIETSNVNINLERVEVTPPVIFNGPKMIFQKTNFSDFMLEENQDRITDNVWITRGNDRGLLNIRQEERFENNFSPEDTEWAIGTTADIESLEFMNWQDAVNSVPPNAINVDYVLHLISENIFIDIKLLSWENGRGSGGGGFSYERSTE
ncbi:hypothetical protein GTQ40_17560 [Flavobacteriaceae bacterium R38]|nr:hypothetical protein [Flavobacteriaceae bacterium R38]